MVRKILKFIHSEIKDAFSWKTCLLIWVPALIIGMGLFVRDRILFPPPPPPTFTYTPPKWDIIQKWMNDQKKKFDNQKQEHQG